MDTQPNSGLYNIPQKKILEAYEQILTDCQTCKDNQAKLTNCCTKCKAFTTAISRFAESNIPVRYWRLEMAQFKGDPILLDKYKEIVSDLKLTYKNGTTICFAGSFGVGKTLVVANILKKAVITGYSGLYVTLNDIVANLTNNTSDDRASLRKNLMTVDFLVIDEFDSRHMGSDKGADLFGRILEDIFRARSQNLLSTFLCTNSPNVVESFEGAVKQSISSLMNYVTTVSVLGKDFRREEKNG